MSESISKLSEIPIKNQEYRCPQCHLIPFIEVTIDQNKISMTTKCVNGHSITDTIDKMQMKCKNNADYYCQLCVNKNKEIKNQNDQKLYYCYKCFKFFCYNHGKNVHVMKDGHNIYFNDSYDNICFDHNGNTLVGYCEKDNKNYCLKCNHFGENNKHIEDEFTDEQIKKYESEYDKNKQMINEIESLFKNYKKMFKEFEDNFTIFKNNIYKKNEILKELINVYKKKQSECSLNYQIKANVEINHFDFSQKKQIISNQINAQINAIEDLIKMFKAKDAPNK